MEKSIQRVAKSVEKSIQRVAKSVEKFDHFSMDGSKNFKLSSGSLLISSQGHTSYVLILHPVNDDVLSLTTIHNEHCVNVLSCLIGIQVPIQLTALARYSATQLRMYTPS